MSGTIAHRSPTHNMLSVIIPSRNEKFLQKTIQGLLKSAGGDIEIIAVLDGYWPESAELVEDKRVIYLHRGKAHGMRDGINSALAISSGEWVMKIDAHCMVADGYDRVLIENAQEDWLVIPRRKRLDPFAWEIKDVGKPDVDYEFLSYPLWKPDEVGIHGTIWTQRIVDRLGKPEYDIDENMSFQGSCWFANKKYFLGLVGTMQEEGYGTFIGEPQEIGLKYWLGGGKVMVNKKTWYAHWHKGKENGRGFSMNKKELIDGNAYSVDFWMNNRWEKRIHDIQWLVERFMPVPSWPEDRSLWKI